MKYLGFILLLSSFQSWACSCMEWEDTKQMLKEADSVVLAVPTKDSEFFSQGEFGPMVKTEMKIVKKYKGRYSKLFYLVSDKGDGANCGLDFKKHSGLFLIFGYKYPDDTRYYASSMCDVGFVFPEIEDVMNAINDLDQM